MWVIVLCMAAIMCCNWQLAGRARMWHLDVYPNLHFIVRLSVISWILEVNTCEKCITVILLGQYKYKFIEVARYL